MTFASINTWAFGDPLHSAQINQVNANLQNALDKTGDNHLSTPAGGISGTVDILSGGILDVQTGGEVLVESGANVIFLPGSAVTVEGTVENATGSVTTNDGGSLTNFLGNATLQSQAGSIVQLTLGAAGTSFLVGNGSSIFLRLLNPSAFELVAGFTRSEFFPFTFTQAAANSGGSFGNANPFGMLGTGVATNTFGFDLPKLHHGALLSSVNVLFARGTGVSSNGGTNPKIDIRSTTMIAGQTYAASYGDASLIGGPVSYAPSYANSNLQSIAVTGLSVAINRSSYNYRVIMTDDASGVGGGGANLYFGLLLGYSSISNMMFP